MNRLSVYGNRPVAPMAAMGLVSYEAGLISGSPQMSVCRDCGTAHLPVPAVCGCGATGFDDLPLPTTGTLYAATTIHAAPGALSSLAPYMVGLVDVADGPRLLLRLLGPTAWQPLCDTPMQLVVLEYEDGPVLAAHPDGVAPADLAHEPREVDMPQPTRPDTTRALVARKTDDGQQVEFENLPLGELPDGDVLVRIEYSGLNYKDALAITGKAPIVRSWPMVLGIDLAGEVVDSRSPKFRPGNAVIVNGFGLSETRWGGFSQYQSLPESVVLPRPKSLSAEQCMQIGTAGYTAMLCVMALTDHGLTPGADAVLVTGATGGVGSVAVSLLARAGFDVVAVTGRVDQTHYLHDLGARDVISRQDLAAGGKALALERWSGAIDVAGGDTLASVIAQTCYDGVVASCGMAGGGELPTSVYPFILRGVTLRGVDSVMVPLERRMRAWARLEQDLDRNLLAHLSDTRNFDDLPQLGHDLLNGKLRGRVAIKVA